MILLTHVYTFTHTHASHVHRHSKPGKRGSEVSDDFKTSKDGRLIIDQDDDADSDGVCVCPSVDLIFNSV